MSDSSLLGVPGAFAFEGIDYRIIFSRDFAVEAAFCEWLERRVYLGICRHRDILGPQDFADQMKGWRQDFGACEYDWTGLVSWRARHSLAGLKELAYLQMQRAEALLIEAKRPPAHYATRDLVERIFKDPVKGEEMIVILKEERPKNDERAVV